MILLWLLQVAFSDLQNLKALCSKPCEVCCAFDSQNASLTFCTDLVSQCPSIPIESYRLLYVFLGAWVGSALGVAAVIWGIFTCCFRGCCGFRGIAAWCASLRRGQEGKAEPLPSYSPDETQLRESIDSKNYFFMTLF
jgi:hypothetical protein